MVGTDGLPEEGSIWQDIGWPLRTVRARGMCQETGLTDRIVIDVLTTDEGKPTEHQALVKSCYWPLLYEPKGGGSRT